MIATLLPVHFLLDEHLSSRWPCDSAGVSQIDMLRVGDECAPSLGAGSLPSDVLKTADARQASTDRARWRSDERRQVRDGEMPRGSWMLDSVPESAESARRAGAAR